MATEREKVLERMSFRTYMNPKDKVTGFFILTNREAGTSTRVLFHIKEAKYFGWADIVGVLYQMRAELYAGATAIHQ